VFLDHKFSYHKNGKITARKPFGPWVAKDHPINEHFATLDDPQELELVLRRAQMALLNPCRDPKYYSSCEEEEVRDSAQVHMEVRFSPNIVRIEIQSHDIHQEVSLYDLPGIFAQTADGEVELPQFVHNLVESYVTESNSIILLVIPMNNDRDNCHAGKLVQGVPLALDRTIGVLTKPDRLEAGIRLDSWSSILAGKTYVLGYGYYVTRQPSPEELKRNITRVEAAENEHNFLSTSPWNGEFKTFKANFGAPKIQEKLGELLVAKIKAVIPQIDAQIKVKLHQVNEGLARLPPPPGDKAMNIVYCTINKIEQDLVNVFSGDVEVELYQNCRKLVHDLSSKLSSISPALQLPPPLWELSSGDEADTPTPTPSKGNKRAPASVKMTPSAKRTKRDLIKRDESTPSPINECPAITYTIDDIRTLRTSVDFSGIPHAVDSRAMKKPISAMLNFWEQPIVNFVDQVNDLIGSTVAAILDRNLAPWATTPFAHQVQALAVETLQIIRNEIVNDAQKTLYIERSTQLMIFDNAYFDHIKNREMSRLEKIPGGEVLRPIKAALAHVTFMDELDFFCQIKAYLHVCNTNLTYHIAKHVLSIFSQIKTQIVTNFHNKLELNAGDVMAKCQALLEEDQQRAAERIRLENDKRRWEAAQKRLQEVLHE